MPNCFQLFRKEDTEKKEPLSLNLVDEEICSFLGVKVLDQSYGGSRPSGFDWYNSIAWVIANNNDSNLGSDNLHAKLNEWYEEDETRFEKMKKVLKFMEDNYISRSFYK